MTGWFTESSLVPMISGSLLAFALLALAVSFRDKLIFIAAIVVAILTVSIVTIETYIVTDRESVTETVMILADAVENNDLETVLKYVSPKRQTTRDRIKSELPDYTFDTCRVIGVVSFSMNDEAPNETAVIDFSAWAEGSHKNFGRGAVQQRVVLTFEKNGEGVWQLMKYRHFDPRKGLSL